MNWHGLPYFFLHLWSHLFFHSWYLVLFLFSICVFAYNTDLLGLEIIVLFAVLGSHLGDMSGFFFERN